ncbi:MAG: aminopeptidase P family protein, partial [Deltaproteobacteria bacterium]|nr:aminopeptidase P family protein [Deltaproteobacteria bacterium]
GYTATDPQLNETSGSLFITHRNQYLMTDSRYELQAAREARGYKIAPYKDSLIRTLTLLARKTRISKLGFEGDRVTVSVYKELVESLKGVETISVTGMVENLRLIKDQTEIRKVVRALRITEAALTETFKFLKPGLTEKEVAHYLEEKMTALGAEGVAFETIVASGPNAALPHAMPSQRRIKESETIIIDSGARYMGYGADITRTIILGTPRAWIKEIYQLVREAQLKALKYIKPGLTTIQADALAREIIATAGYGPNFGHSLGHGVGLATHEAPALSQTRPVELKEGMIVTVEPGIYLPGRGGVRLEEMILLKKNGCRLLNQNQFFYDFSSK